MDFVIDIFNFIKDKFAALFSTQFLLKLLIIAGIYALLNFANNGIRLHINSYSGLDINIKDKR